METVAAWASACVQIKWLLLLIGIKDQVQIPVEGYRYAQALYQPTCVRKTAHVSTSGVPSCQ